MWKETTVSYPMDGINLQNRRIGEAAMGGKWYETSYRRNLVDMHIDDWNPEFLSRFDPQQYFHCLKAGRIQSPMIYLQSHVGLCNWPTKSGRMHAGFAGRNMVRELIDLCHGDGMDVVGYYSLIYNNWAYDAHPPWRMLDRQGHPSRNDETHGFMNGGRYGLVCPNHLGYRAFVGAQFAELLAEYPLEGIFLDMTFWPMVCYCEQCQRRFEEETRQRIPVTIDWSAPLWRQFQASRQRWLNEFALACTAELQRLQPGITVEHQFSTIHQHWEFGVNEGINDASDYAGGDLYGGHAQESFICKLYYEITRNQPFEYMTSRCDPNLLDHTTTKSLDSLRTHNLLTLAHHGAMLFIDAIDPVGTLHLPVYERIGKVFQESIPYEEHLRGMLWADTAIYFQLESRMDTSATGDRPDYANPQLDAAVGASTALSDHRFLYTVVPSSHADKLMGKKVVILCEAAFLSEAELDRLEAYVRGGGCLYASGSTCPELLQRLLGLELTGRTDARITYIAPTPQGQGLFGEFTADNPLAYQGPQWIAGNPMGHPALATVMLPYTNPDDPTRFAAIHSNPPGIRTDFPAIVYGPCGKGKVIWSAAAFEKNPQQAHKHVFAGLIELLYGPQRPLRTTAPAFVQFTLFADQAHHCQYLNAVSVQEHTPLLPPGDFRVQVRMDKAVRRVLLLPDESEVPFVCSDGQLDFPVENMEMFRMYRIEW